jgi:GST-like protein
MRRPIELYYWPTPNGWKISIALEEMGLPYELRPVNIGKGEQFDAAFQAISPNGRMPAIVDPEGAEGRPSFDLRVRGHPAAPGPGVRPILSR